MSSKPSRYITIFFDESKKPLAKFLKACKAFEFNFVKVPYSNVEELRYLAALLEYGFDHIFPLGDVEEVDVDPNKAMVRGMLLGYLMEVEEAVVTVMAQLDVLLENNRRDQKAVLAIDPLAVKEPVDQLSRGSESRLAAEQPPSDA